MITRDTFLELLKPGFAWSYFSVYYPRRLKGENFGRYMATKRRAFKAWIATFPDPEE